MMKLQTVGLIVNPFAGAGAQANLALARRGLTTLGVTKVVTGPRLNGSDALIGTTIESVICPMNEKPSRKQTLELSAILVNLALDAVIVVGGDGTMADVAYVFSQHKNSPPMLGIGAGSTNAGALVSCTGQQINYLIPSELGVVPVNALLAYFGNDLVGVGFNDCVLGYTVVATIDGKLRDVSVVEKYSGENVPTRPDSIGLDQTIVERVNLLGRQVVATGESVGTVIIGLAEPSFIAKAITGGICLTAFSGLKAGCLVADQPLVQVELKPEDVLALPAIRSSYLSFGEQDRIVVRGVREGAGLCVDGTPLKLLTPDQEVSFGVSLNAVRTVKFEKLPKGVL